MKNPGETPLLVTFDLFDTILRDNDAGRGHQRRRESLDRLFSQAGIGEFDAGAVDRAYQAAELYAARFSYRTGRQVTIPQFVTTIVAALGGACSPETIAAATVEVQEASTVEAIEFAEPIINQIRQLSKADVQLGIVSNNFFHAPSYLLELLEGEGILGYFSVDAIAFSSTEGVTKPNPEIFLRVCSRTGVPPERVLHVGDSRDTDYRGAEAAGLRCVLVDPWAGEAAEKILREAFSWTAVN